MIRTLLFVLFASVAVAGQEPRVVAEEALAAWRLGDAKRLDAVAHPEFKKRCRDARIVLFYVEGKEEKRNALAVGSDSDALALFCEALRAIVPHDARFEYFDRFVRVIPKGDLAIVVFESGWRRKSDSSKTSASEQDVVLKKDGENWRFLWLPAAMIHVDLMWDPRQ